MQTATRVGSALLVAAIIFHPARADEPPAAAALPQAEIAPAVREALDRISADSLRGHLSFLASDLLEGRGTPSKGLDIAAEYIAAQFRRAGLEPIGDDGYFQTADWKYLAPEPGSFACKIKLAGETIRVGENQVSAALATGLELPPTAIVKLDASDPEALKELAPEMVGGKVVLAEVPNPRKAPRSQMQAVNRERTAFLERMNELKAALVVDVDGDPESAMGLRSDASSGQFGRSQGGPPRITLHSRPLRKAFEAMPAGPAEATLTAHVAAAQERTVKVRNVIGLLRGSDPEQKETYVLLTAHYDHLGTGPRNESGDRIFNGANDDGSGTASVIEIAGALATLKQHPKRSLVFMAFYGEEHGLVGSRYYVTHPLVPLDKTVADINLEQLGRTDDTDGPRVSAATVTGFDYSDVGAILRQAGQETGVEVAKHAVKSDGYFGASDNASFARAGIPAHTISVSYVFPDYHGLGDEWQKIDYANMAKIDRMAALGLLMIADGPAPAWNKDNPKAAPFRRKAEAAR